MLKAALYQISSQQGGYFTARQAVSAGYAQYHHSYHVRNGDWKQIERGLFRLPGYPDTPESELIRWSFWAIGRSSNRQVVVSHDSALYHYRLTAVKPEAVHLSVPAKTFRKEEKDGCVFHRQDLEAQEVLLHPCYAITTPARTLADMKPVLLLNADWAETVQQALALRLIDQPAAEQLLGEKLFRQIGAGAIPQRTPAGQTASLPFPSDYRQTTMGDAMRQGRRMEPTGWRVTSRSFTLVEMLVVIAIIAVLAGLLMPSLNQAMATARTTQCASNLRQLYLVLMRYAEDFNGSVPMQRDAYNPTFQNSWFYPVSRAYPDEYPNNSQAWSKYGGRKLWHCPECPPNSSSDSTAQGISDYACNSQAWSKYGGRKLWHCPECPPNSSSDSTAQGISDYACNSQWGTRPPDNVNDSSLESFLIRVSAPRPAIKFMLADLDLAGRPKICPVGYFDALYASLRHSSRINMLFFDGHIEARGDIDYLTRWGSYGAYRSAADKRPFN